METQQAPDRNLAMELMRATEAAALAGGRWMGRGDKNAADGAAVEAMRVVLNSVAMDGIVVIGEGEKDEAPMLFNGEEIGDGSAPAMDIAVDPIDGTTLTSLGRPGAIAVIALSERGTMFDPGPCVYMEKIAAGPLAADVIDLNAPVKANLEAVAKALGETRQRRDRGDPRPRPPHRHHPRVPRGRRAHPAHPGRRRRRRDLGRVAQLRNRRAVRHRRHPRRRDRGVRAQVPRRFDPGPPLAAQRRRTPRRARPGLRPRPRAHDRRSRQRRRRVLLRDRHHRRRAAPGRALLGRRREHAEPRDALEVGHDPHHRRDPPWTKLMSYSAVRWGS